MLTDTEAELLSLLQAAFVVRHRHFGRGVRIHILNNVQNGYCPEDCNYCAQAAGSQAPIPKFRMKSDAEILDGARRAHEAGAFRYCVVLSGRGPGSGQVEAMADLVSRIKQSYPVQVCLSAGFIDAAMAKRLKEAGLDRYNHNLNTAESHYGSICTTHDYRQRLQTLEAARSQGLEVCSGIIIGMGETPEQVVEVAATLRRLQARSIPVNFYVHVPGSKLGPVNQLDPRLCLRTLCLFRLMNPDAEVRAAGGREVNLRGLESLALYPANSLFSEGYLNTGGHGIERTLTLIADAGFSVDRIEDLP
ncbi:MAG: biotin synthase BioB [Magnetococcales bacterium]|nr:biotin synthase BioB [Magnetococcales bacterium]MBF0157028.1 biotin synthase BioB [Magnetococcales bacterium]